jgi:iron complex outermembrane receptor protein
LYLYFFVSSVNADNVANSTQAETIEIIEVNSQKRLQDIRDVAISLNVDDGQTIIERQLKDTTPPAVNIRGVGSVDYNTSTQSPVGVYLDGTASASANSQRVNLFDVESVEILCSPQGRLFGRNTTGGAILINSVSAKIDNSGYFSFSYAQRNHLSTEGAINLQLNDNMATRLAFSHQVYEYSTNNLAPNTPQAKMRQTHRQLSVLDHWDKLTIDSKIYLSKCDGIVNPLGSLGVI